jgi:RAQPRD family integrative conjugative element protein
MEIKITLLIAIVIGLFSLPAIANEAGEKIYLTQIMNQLDAIKPLIIAANNEQEKGTRIKFRYTSYRDSNGMSHNGLLEDINIIQKGIQEKLNQTLSEPRHFQAIKGDYLDLKNVKSNLPGNAAEINYDK